jgi:signal transduction histidine kinase
MGQAPPILACEEARLAALYSYDVLDTVEEASFDAICNLASTICETPIALISLLDRKRQWFKSVVGLDTRETERECSICAHAILEDDMLVIDDLQSDERTCDNRLVIRAPKMRFYAGEPLHAFNGLPLGTLCVIDQRPRSLETDMKDALRILARQVEALLEVQRLNAELLRVNTVREKLAQFVAHDLSSPLTAISLVAHELQSKSGEPRLRDIGAELVAAAESMQVMISDLRDSSIGRSGTLAPRYQETNLSDIVDAVAHSMRPQIRKHGLELRIDAPSEVLTVDVDPALLHRLLQNLLVNATHHAQMRVGIGNDVVDDEWVALHVDDDGIGIPDERKEPIFDLYARAPSQRGDAARGIGLAFCRAVAEAHGGTIEVRDRAPRGSRFRVVLPKRRPAPQDLPIA